MQNAYFLYTYVLLIKIKSIQKMCLNTTINYFNYKLRYTIKTFNNKNIRNQYYKISQKIAIVSAKMNGTGNYKLQTFQYYKNMKLVTSIDS